MPLAGHLIFLSYFPSKVKPLPEAREHLEYKAKRILHYYVARLHSIT